MTSPTSGRRRFLPLPSRARQPRSVDDSRMSLLDHLLELKTRLVRSAIAILGAMILFATVLYQPTFDAVTHPYCSLPQDKRPVVTSNGCAFFYSGPFDGFNFRLKIGLIAGILVSAPFWLYQLWAFIAPGLHSKERRYTYSFVAVSTLFFAVGATVAYLVLGTGLEVLLSVGGDHLVALLDINRYLSYVIAVLLVFGIGFEFPLVTTMLNRAGVLSTQRMRDSRRYVIFGMVAFAAVATPGGDPFTMMALAIPLCLMYEGSILIGRSRDRKKRNRAPDDLLIDTDDLDDEVTSVLRYAPLPVAPASSIDDMT